MKIKRACVLKFLFGFLFYCSVSYGGRGYYSSSVMTADEFNRMKTHFGVYEAGKNYNVIINGHGTGLKPPTEKEWTKIQNQPVLMDPIPLSAPPPSVDQSAELGFPPIGNQGLYGSCTAWAVGYYIKTFQEAQEHGWDLSSSYFTQHYIWEIFPDTAYFTIDFDLINNHDKIFSPVFIYHQINGGMDEGSSFEDAMNLVENTGCCTWEHMPADSTPFTATDYTSWANEAGWREAPLYRSGTGYTVIDITTDEGLQSLKQVVADGHLACMALDADYFSYMSSEDFLSLNNYTATQINHANAIVGYDDNYGPYTEQGAPYIYGAFKIVNSWGEGGNPIFWENVSDGFYYMSYECMKQRIQYVFYYEDMSSYNPQLISVFYMDHDSTRGDCHIGFGLGEAEFPVIEKRFDDYTANGGGYPYPSNNMVLDITEFMPHLSGGANVFFMEVYDVIGRDIGRIDTFYIEFYNDYLSGTPTETYLSTDPYPVATEDGDSVYAWVVDKDSIGVTPTDTTLPWQAGDFKFYIDCVSSQALSWTATIVSGGGWLSFVTGSAGVGDDSVTVHFDDNFDVDNPRSGTIRIDCPLALNDPVYINITQSRAEFTVTTLPETLFVSWLGADTLFDVVVDGPDTLSWSAAVTSGTSWLAVVYGSPGTGDGSIIFWIGENSDPSSGRTGTVQITAPAAVNNPFELIIVQSRAEYALATDPIDIVTDWKSGDSTIQIAIDRSYALDWTASVTEGGSWLSIISGSSGSGDGSIDIHFDENNDTENGRIGTIQIVCPLAINNPIEVTVNQERFWEVLLLQPDALSVPWPEGDTLYSVVGYSDNPLAWNASVVEGGSWLSIVSGSSGLGNGDIAVHFEANADPYNTRQGRILLESLTATNTPIEATLTQAKGEYFVEVQPSVMSVSWQSGDSAFQVSVVGPGPLDWTAEVTAGGSWLHITSGNSGSGDEPIGIHWDENINPDLGRSGTVRIVCPDAVNDTTNVIVSQSQTVEFFKLASGAIVNDGKLSEGVSWVDYNGDSNQDIFVANGNDVNQQMNLLFANNGDGSFDQIEMDTGPSFGSSWGDYDNDGDPDLFVTNYGSNFLYRNDGGNTFTKVDTGIVAEDGGYSRGCAWGDYDNDGFLDLFVANYENQANFLYHNNRDGSFTKIKQGEIVTDQNDSRGCGWGDYDSDGDLDLFVVNYNNQNNNLYRNDGDGTFTKVIMGDVVNNGGKSVGCSWGDYNNDGTLDLFVTNRQDQDNYLYYNYGDLTFSRVTAGTIVSSGGKSYGSGWADYDNDGDLDLFVANDLNQNNFLYQNNGDETFTKITEGVLVTDGGNSYGAGWGDYDNDGDEDLFVANYGQDNVLYINNQHMYHWIKIRCVGIVSNSSAIGTTVRVKATIFEKPVWQMRDISGQTGYLSQNNLNAGFGMGDAAVIDSIKVRWSSGIEWDTTNVAVDQFITLYEWANPPSATNDYSATTEEIPVQISALNNDTDPDSDPLIIESVLTSETDGNVAVDPGDTTLTYTPRAGFTGTDRFHYVIRDAHCGRDTAQVSIQVNPKPNTRPVAVHDDTSTISGIAVIIPVLDNDSDPDGDPLQIHALITSGTDGSVSIDEGDTTITYTPGETYVGTDVFQYIISDGKTNGLDTATVTVEVMPIPNERPVAVSDEVSTIQGFGLLIEPLDNDSDPDGDPISISSIDTTETDGTVAINEGDTTVTYTPRADFSGNDLFSYVIHDGRGGLDTAEVSVQVIANHPPAALNDSTVTWEGVTVILQVLNNDQDPDGDDLQITGLDTLTTLGSVSINAGDTSLTYKAPSGFSGMDLFRYVVSDGKGGMDTAMVKIEVWLLSAVYMGGEIPKAYGLSNNYPNPFNPETEFQYQLPRISDVTIVVYSLLGQEVVKLADEKQPPGYFKIYWNGRNHNGQQVPSGIYILRMQADSYRAIRKMMLLR